MNPVPTTQGTLASRRSDQPATHHYGDLAKSLKVLVGAVAAYAVVTLTVLMVAIHHQSFVNGLADVAAIDFEQILRDAAGFWVYPPGLLLLVITALAFITWPRSGTP
jgi:hypothetical protein